MARKHPETDNEQERRTAEHADLFVIWLDLVPSAQKVYRPEEAEQAERLAARMRELGELNREAAPQADDESGSTAT